MAATYDTVNDRVASLTDAHGGTWDYSSPVNQSSSAGYDDAVLASAPEDFWPLNDTAGRRRTTWSAARRPPRIRGPRRRTRT